MHVVETELPGVVVIEPKVFGDSRGYFFEVFHRARYEDSTTTEAAASMKKIVQINLSHSVRGTLRGLHYQDPNPQGKLLWVTQGAVRDIAVDIRIGSPTFGKWTAVELTGENHRQVWVPPGYAHGFAVLSDEADFMYACTDLYVPDCEHSVLWNDPALGIDWGIDAPLLSAKDKTAPCLADAKHLPSFA
jgi:dTDP-4-dehydrorhamnose 3,5-epimerase